MSQVDNIENIAFSSSFEIDKMFDEIFSGSFPVSASSVPVTFGHVTTTSLNNPYGEDVLAVMQFSTDNSNWYEAGAKIFDDGATLDSNFTATCYTNSNNIVIIGQNFTGSTQTCYYRLLLISDD